MIRLGAKSAPDICPEHPSPIDILSEAAFLLSKLDEDGCRTLRRELLGRINDEFVKLDQKAFDSSRHTGIDTFYRVFADCSDIIPERVDAPGLEKSLADIETWWS